MYKKKSVGSGSVQDCKWQPQNMRGFSAENSDSDVHVETSSGCNAENNGYWTQ